MKMEQRAEERALRSREAAASSATTLSEGLGSKPLSAGKGRVQLYIVSFVGNQVPGCKCQAYIQKQDELAQHKGLIGNALKRHHQSFMVLASLLLRGEERTAEVLFLHLFSYSRNYGNVTWQMFVASGRSDLIGSPAGYGQPRHFAKQSSFLEQGLSCGCKSFAHIFCQAPIASLQVQVLPF
eukprot:1157405-Pelagomonas_calceolata.AAC.4